MVAGGKNVYMNRRQIDSRRKKQMIRWSSLLTRVSFWAVIVFCIRDIYARLEEMQMNLERLEMQQYGMVQTSGDVQQPDKFNDVDYVDGPDTWEVGKPIERMEEEVLQRLGELGQTSSLIEGICQNHSRYPKELLAALANNPEMADFVSDYPDGDGMAGGITVSEKEQEFPLFLQWDRRWGYESYGDSCIGLAGCGPTCLSMVLFYLTRDETHTPDSIAAYSMKNGYYVEGTGTSWALMEDVPKLYGIKVSSISRAANNMKAVLDNGGIIICAMGKGDFTISGHYIIIYGYDNEGFMVNDPNCVARSGRRWTFSEIENQIARLKIRLKVFGYMIGRNHSPYASVCFFPGRPGGLIREIAWRVGMLYQIKSKKL